MRVKIKLFATLRENRGKEITMDILENSTIRDIIKALDIKEEEAALIFINGKSVELDRVLQEDDTVSIFPPVGGG